MESKTKMGVDVVVPCYNYGRYLRQCVQSVLAQDGVEVRALIIDDCSNDETPEIGRALAAEDSRVEFRRHEQNQGHIATYNEGLLEWVTAEYCLLLSADDLLTPGALRRAANVLLSYPGVGLVCGRQLLFIDSPPELENAERDADFEIVPGLQFVRTMCETGGNPVNTPTATVRTSLLRFVGGYRPELPHTADMELWLRLAARGDVAVLSAYQALKRAHAAQMQREFVERPFRDFAQRQLAFEMFFNRMMNDAKVPLEFRNAAMKSLAEQAFWDASRRVEKGNFDGIDDLLEYAESLWPEIVARRSWSRLRWKRRLGARGWRWMSPWVDRVRGVRNASKHNIGSAQ